uniref:Putative tick transposon n=1 Tax=Rhipicephalus microplus TaxID=6941 RepID=A0A6M2DEB0_RHIMP
MLALRFLLLLLHGDQCPARHLSYYPQGPTIRYFLPKPRLNSAPQAFNTPAFHSIAVAFCFHAQLVFHDVDIL